MNAASNATGGFNRKAMMRKYTNVPEKNKLNITVRFIAKGKVELNNAIRMGNEKILMCAFAQYGVPP